MMESCLTQCAWCRRFYDRCGYLEPPSLFPGAVINHGICYLCLDAMLATEIERLAETGDVVGAREARERRREASSRLAGQRRTARRERYGQTFRPCQVLAGYKASNLY